MNILCVKIGKKYPAVLVNRLLYMCRKNITTPFNFVCYTDDPTGISEDVIIVPYVDHNLDVITHNKMYLFSEEFDNQIPTGPRVFFDLDMIIKSNVDHVVRINNKQLTVIRSSWREELKRGFPIWHHMLNSSCMTWESPHTRCIWDHFMKDPEHYTCKYHWGMDCFLSYEQHNAGTVVHMFPERIFYSHLHGIDIHETYACYNAHKRLYTNKYPKATSVIPIVLLNGDTTEADYERYKQFYTD